MLTEISKYLSFISLMWFSSTGSTYSLALLFAAWLDGHSEEMPLDSFFGKVLTSPDTSHVAVKRTALAVCLFSKRVLFPQCLKHSLLLQMLDPDFMV